MANEARRFTYTVALDGDITRLQQAVNEAMKALHSINAGNGAFFQLTDELREASVAAAELEAHMRNAINPQTGQFDLMSFDKSLQASGQTIEAYGQKLISTGQLGQDAFLRVAEAISMAEMPVRRTTKLMDSLWVTMKNTMRWQLTTAMLRGFITSVSTAFNYTQDLNESLNNIRIVTQKSSEDMANFATQANNAAKALSTTTTNYTDASLIYYQQGLSDEEVAGRTETTIRLANVTGESAEKVSEEMTAIWNNFDDGSKSLEYYADVITALGATTASSSAEIAEGVQKFAAVADAVGLSYEYATTALATLVAETRQSPDIIGTSLRTLFARIQGLQQDEEQEDGTNLNKYSQALMNVGVNIKDVNGDLKGMDQLLNEVADRWTTLSQAQRLALAQTVAGIRQYTQFVALMDNWEVFQENLVTAQGSEGTLQKQADIYAESWEAARDRVTAAAEDIYDSIFDEDTFIGMDNAFAGVLSVLADVTEGFGGLKGIISVVGNLLFSLYGDKMAAGMRSIADAIGVQTGLEQNHLRTLQQQTATMAQRAMASQENTEAMNNRIAMQTDNVNLQELINSKMENMNELERKNIAIRRESIAIMRQITEQFNDQLAAVEKQNAEAREALTTSRLNQMNPYAERVVPDTQLGNTTLRKFVDAMGGTGGKQYYQAFNQLVEGGSAQALDGILNRVQQLSQNLDVFQKMSQALEQNRGSAEGLDSELVELAHAAGLVDDEFDAATLNAKIAEVTGYIETLRSVLTSMIQGQGNEAQKKVEAFIQFAGKLGAVSNNTKLQMAGLRNSIEQFSYDLESGKIKIVDWASTISLLTQQLFQLSMGLNALNSLADLLTSDEDLTFAEKATRFLSAMAMLLPTIGALIKGLPALGSLGSLSTIFAQGAANAVQAGAAVGGFSANVAGMSAAVSAAIGPIMAIVGAIALLTVGISRYIQARNEAAQKSREAIFESTKAMQEEIDSNRELIDSYQEALDAYAESRDHKEELDKATTELANAYDLEGAALAKLSGQYEDYNALLKKAQQEQRRQLREQLQDLETNTLPAASSQMWANAREGKGFKIDDRYQLSFGSFIDTGEEADAMEVLRNTVSDEFLNGESTSSIAFKADINDVNSLIKLYDELYKVRQKLDVLWKNDETSKLDSGIYKGLDEWLDKMEESVTYYRENVEKIAVLKASLNDSGMTDELVQNLSDYREWLKQVSDILQAEGVQGEELEDAINAVVDTSLNPKIKEFQELSDAIEEAKNLVGGDFADQIEEIFTSGNYDNRILGAINWQNVNDKEGFEAQYQNLERYYEITDNLTDAQNRYNAAKEAFDALGDGAFDDESLTKLSEFNWSDAEQGIISFNEFLGKSTIEQQKYLHQLMDQSRQDTIASFNDYIAYEEEIKREAVEALAEIDDQEREQNYHKAETYNELTQAYEKYLKAVEEGTEQDFEPPQIDWSDFGEGIDWESYINDEELRNTIEEAGEAATLYVNNIQVNEDAIDNATEEIEKTKVTIQVELELQYQDKLTDIRNSTDELVQVFDAMADGTNHVTTDSGERMWTFSREAAEAINQIYKGFLTTAEVMRDGTFALTDDMYNAFFNSTNGIVAANADGMASLLQNEIELLKAKRESAAAALDIAERLQSGELQYAKLDTTQKEILQKAYLEAQQTNNDDLLNDNVELLGKEQTNWSTLWEQVSGYSSEAGINMAENIADGTKSILENLESIRDAAYQAGLQVSAIGADNFEDISTFIDTNKISHGTGGHHITVNQNVDTEHGAGAFMDSLVHEVTGSTWDDLVNGEDDEVNALLAQVSQSMIDTYSAQVSMYDDLIAANKVAYSKLFESLNRSIEGNGGGKNSGSSAKNNAEDLITLEDLAAKQEKILDDRYHEVNRAIQDQDELLQDVAEDIDLAYGSDRLKLFKKQLEEINKQADNYQWKMNLADHFIQQDKADVMAAFGLTEDDFNAQTGEILHYQDVLESLLDDYTAFANQYNAFINEYNNLTEEQQEARQNELEMWKKDKEYADKDFDDRLALLEKYEDSIDQWQDAQNEWKELMREQEDTKLKEITYKMEVILEIKNAEDEIRDFTKKVAESFSDELYHQLIGPDAPGFDRKGTILLDEEQARADLALMSDYQAEYDDLMKRMSEANEFTNMDDLKDAFLELSSNILETGENLLDWIESLQTLLPNAIDAARERFDQFTNQLAHNNTMLDTIEELYTLQGETYKTQQGFDRFQKVAQERIDANVANARLNKQWSERAKKDLDVAQKALDDLIASYAGQVTEDNPMPWESDVMYDTLKANRDALLEEFNDAQEAMFESAQEAMQAAQDMYLQQVEKAVYDFGQALTDGQGLDLLQDKYDHYIEAEGRYFDKVNEAYNVAAWYNKLQQAIDESTNSTLTENLKALQEEIDLRREGGTLSQYDLEILEAKYKVLQAQAALEDAQNNKNELRLTRDRQGNWNYQYNANPDEIADKQQELLDAENEWYNIAKQQVEDVTGEIVDTWNECSEKIKEVYSDMTLTDQERADRAAEIYEYYAEKVKYLEQEKQNAIQDMTEAGNKSLFDMAVVAGDEVADLTGITADEIKQLIEESGKSLLELLLSNNEQIKDIVGSNSSLIDDFDNVFARDLDNMTKNAVNFEDELTKALDTVQDRFLTYGDVVSNVADETGTNLQDLDQKTQDLSDSTDRCRWAGEDLNNTMWNMLDAVMSLSMAYGDLANQILQAVYAAQQLASQSVAAAGSRAPNSYSAVDWDVSAVAGELARQLGYSDVSELPQEVLEGLVGVRDAKGLTEWGTGMEGLLDRGNLYIEEGRDFNEFNPGEMEDYLDELDPWLRELIKQTTGFATGGYTGEFDNQKLAFLHEKELVLNQEDTENILAAVQAIRSISPDIWSAIESQLDNGAGAAMMLMGDRLSASGQGIPAGTQQQSVYIEANFPNATDRNEIAEALRSLTNDAAQYIRRRRE